VAHPNIALAKYWGKTAAAGNYPAVPSLSVTLAGMQTRTEVTFDDALAGDRFVLDGDEQHGRPLERVVQMLDEVRREAGIHAYARVASKNDFPTASGLASSASGFAALAFASLAAAGLSRAADVAASRDRASELARRASVSAARSAFGGFVELPAGSPDRTGERLVARPLAAPPSFVDELRVLVAVATEGKKAVSSTDGMGRTSRESPYYGAWVHEAPRMCGRLREAVLSGDFDGMGLLAEASALAMHASAIAAGVVYWNGVTLDLMAAVRALRAEGAKAYFTIDAGPHVKVLVRAAEEARVASVLSATPGVVRVLHTRPGAGADLTAPGSDGAGKERR
jgi:diphosphomevalonate decarboxylase